MLTSVRALTMGSLDQPHQHQLRASFVCLYSEAQAPASLPSPSFVICEYMVYVCALAAISGLEARSFRLASTLRRNIFGHFRFWIHW